MTTERVKPPGPPILYRNLVFKKTFVIMFASISCTPVIVDSHRPLAATQGGKNQYSNKEKQFRIKLNMYIILLLRLRLIEILIKQTCFICQLKAISLQLLREKS